MIKKFFFAALSCSLLSGCSGLLNSYKKAVVESVYGKRPTTTELESTLQSVIGKSDLELVKMLGSPDKTYYTNGHKFLSYTNNYSVNTPSVSPNYRTNIYGSTAYTTSYGGRDARVVTYSCTITFEVVNEKISGTTYFGDGCTY